MILQNTLPGPAHAEAVTAAPRSADAASPARHASSTLLTPSLLATTAALAACGGGDNVSGAGPTGDDTVVVAHASISTALTSDVQAARFLLQAQFSASDAEIASVRALGYQGWLLQQFSAAAGVSGTDWLNSRGYNKADVHEYYDETDHGDYMIWQQLMTRPDAVRQRLALALSEYFVVSLTGLNFDWSVHGLAGYWDLLSAQAFGNFRQLLEAITLNPAMGYFLATKGSQKEDSAGRQPDENYAREVMQLFTIGLYQLNPDGTEKRDGNGNKIETYTQTDVSNLARVFTGYDFDDSLPPVMVNSRVVLNPEFARRPMKYIASRHSTLAASFLGTTVAANTDGPTALRSALDTLFNHPNVGPFFARQMIQRLVTSNPSPAYVARVASAFNNNGTGVRGDLRAVWTAILLDDEARGPNGLTQPGFGKLREPMLRLAQWGRTFGAKSAYGSWKIDDLSDAGTQLGQSPLRSPSVFNFFRPGYVPPGTALAASAMPAPEFQLVNESTVAGYLNFMVATIRGGLWTDAPNVPYGASNATDGYDIKASYSAELAIVTDATALVNRLNLLLCAGQLSAATCTLFINALNTTRVTATSGNGRKLDRIASAVLLVMASAEYLIQK
jgi:uncharacterized protein (DUF1800 family)